MHVVFTKVEIPLVSGAQAEGREGGLQRERGWGHLSASTEALREGSGLRQSRVAGRCWAVEGIGQDLNLNPTYDQLGGLGQGPGPPRAALSSSVKWE